MDVVFSKDTWRVTGLNRAPLPYETEIKNVDTTGLQKAVYVPIKKQKVDAEGKGLFWLPQEPVVTSVGVPKVIVTLEVTEAPVTVTEDVQEPLLNSEGNHMSYFIMGRGKTTEVTEEPVMVDDVQELNENGAPLYWGIVPVPPAVFCYTTKTVEVPKTDDDGNPLYWKTVTEQVDVSEAKPSLEITSEDARYTEGLAPVLEDGTLFERTTTFEDEYALFTYEEVMAHKERMLLQGTFFTEAVLFEQMELSTFSTDLSTFNADLGHDFVSIPAGGELRTEKLLLPKASDIVSVIAEASADGLQLTVGALASDMQAVIASERDFGSEVVAVYVGFKNPTAKRIDLHSFALLV